jgi:streptomycin 6-kinase
LRATLQGASRKGTPIAKLALLGNYMAASFVTAADGHGGTLVTEAAQTANQLLATPHTG